VTDESPPTEAAQGEFDAHQRTFRWPVLDWRMAVGAAAVVAGLAALVTSWWMPHGPMASTEALTAMPIGAAVGFVAGRTMRSRWAMVLAPVAYVLVFELARLGVDGPSTDAISLTAPGGFLAFIFGRGFHGLVGLLPMVLGAAFGAALTRETTDEPRHRTWSNRLGLYTRRSMAAISLVALVALAIVIARPAAAEPIRDEKGDTVAGSFSEKIHVDINGVDMGMFIKGTNADNPVLLFVHGGPGMPEYWMTQRHPIDIYDEFTVVWWDQRGAGLSYDPDIAPETMTAEQFVDDTLSVTRYLLDRFDQDKLYLMAHSWGSYNGIQAVSRAPELYSAYIGVGQMTYQIESEQLAYEYAIAHFNELGDDRMVRRLEAAPPSTSAPLPSSYMALRDDYMHKAGIGTTHAMRSVISGVFLPSLRSSDYTAMEKVNLWRGKLFSRLDTFGLWDTMLMTDLRREVPRVDVPVYFLHGRYDYTCAYPLAKDYFDALDASVKGFYTFENSAHSPIFEEPERTVAILVRDVLNGDTSLSD